jgi:succinate dehydrogenase/fumarate reductase flavoprotein subunit
LQEYSPAVAELPTTNGDWAQGEGIQLGAGLGAALLHMDQVQVHPTGFVDPADPGAGTKVGSTVDSIILASAFGRLSGSQLHMEQLDS